MFCISPQNTVVIALLEGSLSRPNGVHVTTLKDLTHSLHSHLVPLCSLILLRCGALFKLILMKTHVPSRHAAYIYFPNTYDFVSFLS